MSQEVRFAILVALATVMVGSALGGIDRQRTLGRAGARRERSPAPKRRGAPSIRAAAAGVVRWLGGGRPAAMFACGLSGAGIGIVVAAGPGGAICGAAGLAVPGWIRSRRSGRRAALVEQQLADAMDGIAAALRAGMSPVRALSYAAEEGEPPVAAGLAAVVEREELGMPLDQSLETWARSEQGDDVRLAVSVLQLQHRVGGNAPAVLEEAVRTLRQRASAARDLRSMTAQARLSGAILGLLPVGFFLFMSVVSRHEVTLALRTPLGATSVAGGLLLDGAAFLWIRHLLREAQ
ncbi:MAG TPA: type II secretion system F family protein [Actinomycetota bacterium]|nr:type II secretion system F family protein [Actinomycetota bacterium]